MNFETDSTGWTTVTVWKVTYTDPYIPVMGIAGTPGTQEMVLTTHAELVKEKAWLDQWGYTYSVEELSKGTMKAAKDMTDAELRRAWRWFDANRPTKTPAEDLRWGELDCEFQRRSAKPGGCGF